MLRPAHLARAKAKHVTLSAIAVAAVAFLFFQWLMVPHPGSASNPGAPLMVPPAIHTKPYISDRSIYVNETVTVRFSMRRLSGSSGNGGITVSFPDLDQANSLQSSSSYASADGSVSTWSYTNGTSKVHYFPSGYSPIHLANGGTDIARYLIVETDDTDWPDTNSLEDHRTLELRVTPKREMTFRIYYRFWLCRSGYDDCARHPGSTRVDQQGWNVGVYYVTVRNRAPSVARVTPSASTVTLDPGDRQTFSARATDADANISEWDWFLDGVSQNGQSLALTGDITRTFSHTFPTAGRYTVQSKFTDLDGESASAIWTVRVPPPSVSVTVASRPSGRTVTVDGTARTTPYTVTWDSGSSHRLNVPYSQPVGQDRYVFSHWSHGGVQRHSVAPTRNTTYTANFTLQHFLSARTDPRGIGVPGGETWYDHNATVTVGPAPTIPGYVFSYWRKGGSQNIGSSPSRVTVRVDSSFLVEAVYVVAPSAPAIHTKPYISDRSIYVNETVTVRFSMRRLSGSSGNGGITVSFPDLDQANSLQSSSSYASADGSVSTWSYTNGTSKVHYFPSGYSPIHLANGGTDIARYLIVETDDTDWPDTNSLEDHRTLELRVTPKREMTFRIYYRFWLCRSGYDDCARHPGSTRVDQQGWNVGVYYVTVRNRAPSVARVTPSASTVTLDPGDRQTFSARATDADANISEWDWFLDGVSQNGQSLALTGDITRTFSHTFPTAGRYTVQSKFTDLDGESASAIWTVRVPPPSVSVTVASRPSGRTVTVDGTARTTPYTVTWDSGSSHRLNVPYSQLVGQDRYVFSHWSHGGSQSQSVAPSRNTTYTANFNLQHFLSTRTEPGGIGIPGGGTWYNHNATATVGPAPTISGYVFSYWRKDGRNIGSSPSGVSVRVASSFLVEAVYVEVVSVVPPATLTTRYISDRSIYVNETVTVRFSMRRLSGSSGNGGITVSFPDLDQSNSLQSSSSYDSANGSVSTSSYTNGSSKVHYSPRAYSPINLANGSTGTAQYLIVESDDTDWPDTNLQQDYRTLELRVTPKREGTFRIYYRFWLCSSGYSDCQRSPISTRVDQQGWNVGVYNVTVRNRPPTVTRVSPSSASIFLNAGERQTFSARATDADANISEWGWFLDGVAQNGQSLALTGDITRTFSHTFSTAGTYTVEAEFTDLDGEYDSVTWRVAVTSDSYDGATRRFNPEWVAPGGSVTVTIQVGQAFSITETLPDGFTYTGSSIDDPAADNDVLTVGQTVTFTPVGEGSFTYTVTASRTEGSHAFSGVARFDNNRNNDLPVGGASIVTVEAVIDEATLVARYDTNNNGTIEKDEVIAAINEYLFGDGDEAISKGDLIRLINLYLFG